MFQGLFAGVTKKELHGPSAIQRTGNRVPSCKPFPHKLLCLSYHNALASCMDMHLHHHEIKMKKIKSICPYLDLNQFPPPRKKRQLAPRATQIHPAGTESRSQIWYIAPISTLYPDKSLSLHSQGLFSVKLNLVRIVTGFQPQRQKMRQPAPNSHPEWHHHKSLDRG